MSWYNKFKETLKVKSNTLSANKARETCWWHMPAEYMHTQHCSGLVLYLWFCLTASSFNCKMYLEFSMYLETTITCDFSQQHYINIIICTLRSQYRIFSLIRRKKQTCLIILWIKSLKSCIFLLISNPLNPGSVLFFSFEDSQHCCSGKTSNSLSKYVKPMKTMKFIYLVKDGLVSVSKVWMDH